MESVLRPTRLLFITPTDKSNKKLKTFTKPVGSVSEIR